MVRKSDFSLVLHLLITSPVFLALVLLPGHSFIFFDDLPVVGGSAGVLFVFEHATHPEDGLLLSSPVGLFLPLCLGSCHPFTSLLVGPVFLVLSVELHTLMVHYSRERKRKTNVIGICKKMKWHSTNKGNKLLKNKHS